MEKRSFNDVAVIQLQINENTCRIINRWGHAHTIRKAHANYNSMFSAALTAGANDLTVNLGCEVDEKDFIKGSEEMGGWYEDTNVTHLTLNCRSDTKK